MLSCMRLADHGLMAQAAWLKVKLSCEPLQASH